MSVNATEFEAQDTWILGSKKETQAYVSTDSAQLKVIKIPPTSYIPFLS